ncbi:stage II sporulation protein M [Proteinivorax tanatarense]|uniref:Stage II sporulation protein M n=1 Tax=Proteinivorax tanatarense TaxID=1260629 RepID=A0AAU7VN87_9FIRM
MLLDLYKKHWDLFKHHYAKPTALITLASLVIALVGYFYFIKNEAVMLEFFNDLMLHFESMGVGEQTTHSELFTIVLFNNLRVSAFMIILGFIPVIVLPSLSGVATTMSVSMVTAFFSINDMYPLHMLAFGIFPHGIIELFAIYLAGGIGVYMSLNLFKKIFSPKRAEIKIGSIIKQSLLSYLLLVAPLIILAALIEGFITPVLIESFYPGF